MSCPVCTFHNIILLVSEIDVRVEEWDECVTCIKILCVSARCLPNWAFSLTGHTEVFCRVTLCGITLRATNLRRNSYAYIVSLLGLRITLCDLVREHFYWPHVVGYSIWINFHMYGNFARVIVVLFLKVFTPDL